MNEKKKLIVGIVLIMCIVLISIFVYSTLSGETSKIPQTKVKTLDFKVPKSSTVNVQSLNKMEYYRSEVPFIAEKKVKNFKEYMDSSDQDTIPNEFDPEGFEKEDNFFDQSDFIELHKKVNTPGGEEGTVFDSSEEYNETKHGEILSNNKGNELSIENEVLDIDDLISKINQGVKEAEHSENKEPEKEGYIAPEDVVIESKTIIKTPDNYSSTIDSLTQNAFFGENKESKSNGKNEIDSSLPLNQFIRAEFYRTITIKQNDIVEIRLLEEVEIYDNFILPVGTILYGISSIAPRRLFVRLTTNIYEKKSVQKSLVLFDFDGREGVYLKEQELYKFPAEITKELTEIIKSQYRQNNPFGSANEIELEKVAAISAIDKIYSQLNKVRIKINGGYKLWLKII